MGEGGSVEVSLNNSLGVKYLSETSLVTTIFFHKIKRSSTGKPIHFNVTLRLKYCEFQVTIGVKSPLSSLSYRAYSGLLLQPRSKCLSSETKLPWCLEYMCIFIFGLLPFAQIPPYITSNPSFITSNPSFITSNPSLPGLCKWR